MSPVSVLPVQRTVSCEPICTTMMGRSNDPVFELLSLRALSPITRRVYRGN